MCVSLKNHYIKLKSYEEKEAATSKEKQHRWMKRL